MPDSKAFRFGYGLIIIFAIIYLASLVDWIFYPVVVLVQTLAAPILLAGVLYYLLRPIVDFLSWKIPRGIAILLIYIIAIGLIVMVFLLIGPILQAQFHNFVRDLPILISEARQMIINIQEFDLVQRFQLDQGFSFEEISGTVVSYLNDFVSTIGKNAAAFIGLIANTVIVLIIIPFVLYYMLKEGEKAPKQMLRLLPEKQRQEGRRILKDMDFALSSYIQGQIIVSFCVGVMAFIGYNIIGLEYSLILALIAMFTNVIPFVGPWIGTIPGVIVGLLTSPWMALWVIITILIIQQIESNLIAPQVMGRKLAIHPVTIILLLLVAARFGGFIGLLVAVPAYAVLKVVVSHTYRLLELRKYT
ncbi:AI-2E family transporter [Desertibacillus haloalkaliphilus]|uniref:AI-2E family transporter n=1 Tax=Desertibacillus haloalkaliphilus TaxID=1328930 RepID=UPI001C25D815|nr:AI-2E family transporter [Desertibacillus haloalkaliphilus]MBU8906639.1 AI-2E family transporter [Desertibacillus haloalkaliphilus]